MAGGHESRASNVVQRILDLDEETVGRSIEDVMRRFGDRHRDLSDIFRQHAARIGNRLQAQQELSDERMLLLGATFTHEYSVEAAALCNPSMVLHPDQASSPAGSVRFVMSVRSVGEGHRSSIGFREGMIDNHGHVSVDPPAPFPVIGTPRPTELQRALFHGHLRDLRQDGESAAFVLDALGTTFTHGQLEKRLTALGKQRDTRRNVNATIDRLRTIAARSYKVDFPGDVELSQRILWPAVAAESNGMEDARFVQFTDDDGTSVYYATYTAYDGTEIRQQLLATRDFAAFEVSSLAGAAAANKGLALFPRRINGRFAALSRYDREKNAIAFSDDPHIWDHATTIQVPTQPWEVIQLGNCGPPIETPDGWLVLTHGVGPMRTYSIGAILLDLDDPTVVIGQLTEPLITPAEDERDGYVPNVVYSCGGLLCADTIVIPFGVSDTSTSIATLRWSDLRNALLTN
ncbi:MAG TPA: glycoside hydrolase family 130 protein [Acidimicrobiales bacterium]|nr:glycoside hydrolase family 130 protein [Acidimicrobiales bacterium]